MKILDKFFNRNKNKDFNQSGSEHAVIIHFKYGFQELQPLYDLEDKIEEILSKSKVGILDGHEIAVDASDGFLYMYGQNTETLFKKIKPTLESCYFMKRAIVKLRFGPAKNGVKEIEVEI